MSTVVSKNVQIGADGTASNNFTAYQPATPDGTLRIGNGNSGSVTDAITLTSSGNVGIGTTSPSGKLAVYGGRTFLAGGNENYTLGIGRESNNNSYYLGVHSTATPDLLFSNNAGTETMRLTYGGRVGIGTNSPSEQLEVATTGFTAIRVSGGDSNSQQIKFYSATQQNSALYSYYNGGAPYFSIINNGSERLRINSSGNLLVGTTAGNKSISIQGNGISIAPPGASPVALEMLNGYGARQGVTFINNGSISYTSFGIISENTALTIKTASYAIGENTDLTTGWTERLRIDSSGNVGIGTSSPAGVLDVGGNTLSSQFFFRNNGSYGSGGGGATIANFVYGGINIAQISNTGTGQRDATFKLFDEGVAKVIINANNSRGGPTYFNGGSVGIGTSSPQAPLHVTGTIKVATGNAQGILGLGEAFGSTVNVGLWRGAANAPTTDGNFLNLGGYDGIVFATGAAAIGSQTERARIDADGLKFNGDTAAANALDDYEEGTWTPDVINSGATSTWALKNGKYVKVGNVVHAWGVCDTGNSGGGGGQLTLINLPFATAQPGGASTMGIYGCNGSTLSGNIVNSMMYRGGNGYTDTQTYVSFMLTYVTS